MRRHSQRFRTSFGKVWRPGGRSSVTPARTILIIGSVILWGRSFTPSPFSLLVMPLKETGALASIRHFWRALAGVEVLSSLDLEAIPPFQYVHEHFGYRDRLTTPEIEGTGIEPTPGSGPPIKAGEFILGYPDEEGPAPKLPRPEILSRNGSYMAYRRLRQHVGAFRDFLREQGGPTADDQELLAAKLMGRWRSGAPLVLAPDKDDPSLADDPQRNNNFNYAKMDPQGYAVPLGAHIRRMNPRDTAANIQRRKMIRRGATYGPALPEGAPEDGIDRGIAAFVICASLDPPIRICAERLGQRPEFPRVGQ